jgi:phage shock protein A
MTDSTEKADTFGQAASPPSEETDGLSPLELRFVDLSATGETMEVMASALGVCTRTLRRWKKRPEVASAIRERTSEAMALARATLAAAANRAARELDRLATSAEPDHARIAACKAVIENAAKFAQVEELQQRLTEIEARLAQQPARPMAGRFGT